MGEGGGKRRRGPEQSSPRKAPRRTSPETLSTEELQEELGELWSAYDGIFAALAKGLVAEEAHYKRLLAAGKGARSF